MQKRICSMLEQFVYDDNSRLAGQFPQAQQYHVSTMSSKDPQDLGVGYKDQDVAKDGFRDVVKCLIKDNLFTCILDAILVNSRLNRVCEELNALAIEASPLENLRLPDIVTGKNSWTDSCVASCSKGSTERATKTCSSDLEVEVGSKASEYLLKSSERPLKRRASCNTSCSDHIEHRESIASSAEGRLTSTVAFKEKQFSPCGPRINKQVSHGSSICSNPNCHMEDSTNAEAAWMQNTTADAVSCQCVNTKHVQRSMSSSSDTEYQTAVVRYCEKSTCTDCKCVTTEEKSVQIHGPCIRLKLVVRKIFLSQHDHAQRASKYAKVAYVSLPCKVSSLTKQIFLADPLLSDSCLLVMKRKFESELRNVCSCLNDVLARLNANFIAELRLNCDIRPGCISFRLESSSGKRLYFASRVPVCRHVHKRSVNMTENVTGNVAQNVTDNTACPFSEQTVCKCKMCSLNDNHPGTDIDFNSTKDTASDLFWDDDRDGWEKQTRFVDNGSADGVSENIVDTAYERQKIHNLYLFCSNNDIGREVPISKKVNISHERTSQCEKEVEFIFSRDFNKGCEEKEFVLSSINTSRNGLIGSDKTDCMEDKAKEFGERVGSNERQEEKFLTVNENFRNIEEQDSSDNSLLKRRHDESVEVIRTSSLKNRIPFTEPTKEDDFTEDCLCCANNRAKFTSLQEIIDKLQVSPFEHSETTDVNSISLKDETSDVPKNGLASTMVQTAQINKVSIGINVNTIEERTATIPVNIPSSPCPKTVDQCTETEKRYAEGDVRNQSQNTEKLSCSCLKTIPETISDNERRPSIRLNAPRESKVEQIAQRLSSTSESERISRPVSTNRHGSFRSGKSRVTLPTSHPTLPLRHNSRKNLRLSNADVHLRAKVSLNESRRRRRVASVTKISYRSKLAKDRKPDRKYCTRNSIDSGNQHGSLPNKSVDKLKQLICTKLLRMLADKASDKATNTSKTFLRNERYVVSVLKGKLNRSADDFAESHSLGNSSICTGASRVSTMFSEVCASRMTTSDDLSGYSKLCRCGTDGSVKNCSPRLSGGACEFFTESRCMPRIPNLYPQERRNIRASHRIDIGDTSRARRKMSVNYCENERLTSDILEERRRTTSISTDSWHGEYRSREIFRGERKSTGIPGRNFPERSSRSKCPSNRQRSSESSRERGFVVRAADEPVGDRCRPLKSHPTDAECRSGGLLNEKIPPAREASRTRYRKRVPKTCFISGAFDEPNFTSRVYRSNADESVVCNCEQCLDRRLGPSYARSAEVSFDDAANCPAYGEQLPREGKIGRAEGRRRETETRAENYRDKEGRYRSSRIVKRISRVGHKYSDEVPKSLTLVGRHERTSSAEKNLNGSAGPISSKSSRSKNSVAEVRHSCRCAECGGRTGLLKEEPSNILVRRTLNTREKESSDCTVERVADLETDFKYKLSRYVALCKSVKRTLIKRLRRDDIYEVSSMSMPRHDGRESKVLAK